VPVEIIAAVHYIIIIIIIIIITHSLSLIHSLTYLLTHLFTYLLHWAEPSEKLTGFQLVNKFPAFYGTRRFITAFTSAHHLSLSWASYVQVRGFLCERSITLLFIVRLTQQCDVKLSYKQLM